MTESIENSEELASLLNQRMKTKTGGSNQRLAMLLGWRTRNNISSGKDLIAVNIPKEDRSDFSLERFGFMLSAPFDISHMCCNVMKKAPVHEYAEKTGRYAITGQMADESRLRLQQWLRNGCNGFNMKRPVSNPMSFWTEQDVLTYIVKNNLKICSVYGDVVVDYGEELEGQMTLGDFGLYNETKKYKCTGCKRTGCMLCGFGCHLEKKDESRFLLLKQTHPKMYALLDVIKNNGVSFREAIEWTNEHMTGRGHIWI